MPKNKSRPTIWIGHVTRRVKDVKKSTEFFETLGLRVVWADAQMAILELRGGTHLLLFADGPRHRKIPNDEFDLMVEDIEASRKSVQSNGIKVSRVKRDPFHTYFDVSDPNGKKWRINSDHTDGRPV